MFISAVDAYGMLILIISHRSRTETITFLRKRRYLLFLWSKMAINTRLCLLKMAKMTKVKWFKLRVCFKFCVSLLCLVRATEAWVW